MKLNTIARIAAVVILSLAGIALAGGAALADSCGSGGPGHVTNPFNPPYAVAP
ncbi:hypothetical protein C8D88_11438 [Lentzea atacamensis]|uniref:Chaplin n=2 Tax=Lentzea TaxID=165301 RepID=A0A316HV21_9PSEU|nr:hypothetical protein [Lentzea atacamensis]PWK82171.1 hypothetical protein C8D88_11438 [Lentzea atacamensis]RAS64742.1 hypothetical protein C8D87_105233 [Lentzea atacamensis]